MLKKITSFLLLSLTLLNQGFAGEEIIRANDVELWCETFGDPTHPAVLLSMGGSCQGIMWPEEFCKTLSERGYFVIRYDHRDVGDSQSFNFFKTPYNLMDLTKDAIGILDHFEIEKASFVGISMGGQIGQLMGAHFPERVRSLTLISTSSDYISLHNAFEGKPPEGELSGPTDEYLTCVRSVIASPAKSEEEKLEQHMRWWSVTNGSGVPFDEELHRDLLLKQIRRTQNPQGTLNHVLAMKASINLIKQTPQKIALPTTVIHGTHDPIFPQDHGKALASEIPSAKLVILEGMGHTLNTRFFLPIIDLVDQL